MKSNERKLDKPIRISLETKSRLIGFAIYGDDYDSIINRLMDMAEKKK